MKSKSGVFFEVKVRYDKTMENVLNKSVTKSVTEQYVVEAFTFTDAERVITDKMISEIGGEFSVVAEKIANFKEIFSSENVSDAIKWYKVKIQSIEMSDDGREKKINETYLVLAGSVEAARKVASGIEYSILDHEIVSIVETPFLDVFYMEEEE